MGDERRCGVCEGKLSPNGHCHRCLELKALARDPGFYNVCVVLGDGKPLPKLDDIGAGEAGRGSVTAALALQGEPK